PQVRAAHAFGPTWIQQRIFQSQLLRARHDIRNHRTGDKVPGVQNAVRTIIKVDADKGAIAKELVGGKLDEILTLANVRNIFWEVRFKDIFRTLLIRAIDAHLNVEAACAHDW